MDEISLQVLADIRQFLYVPHLVQEILSAEKTPTLSIVLPMYEKLIVMLNDLKRKLPKLTHAISASVYKLNEYLGKSRKTKLYALAISEPPLLYGYYFLIPHVLAINPTIKLKWLEDHWERADYEKARQLVRASVCMFNSVYTSCLTNSLSSCSNIEKNFAPIPSHLHQLHHHPLHHVVLSRSRMPPTLLLLKHQVLQD